LAQLSLSTELVIAARNGALETLMYPLYGWAS
jgi:hypothetical protein